MYLERLENRCLLAADGFSDLVALAADSISFLTGDGRGFTTAEQIGIAADGKDMMVLDFDGDDQTDVIGRFQGQWLVASSGTGELVQVGTWADINWRTVHFGDFNGDGLIDIAGMTPESEWWLLRNEGQGRTTNQFLGRWNANVDWHDITFKDFTGDGITDIIARTRDEWWLSQGSADGQLPHRFLGRWADVVWADVTFGQFVGDARPDIAARDPSGRWWALEMTHDRLLPRFLATWGTHTTWSDLVVADFDRDGYDELLARSDLNEWWRVHRDGPEHFATSFWAQWSEVATWQDVTVGDFTNDGFLDLLGRAIGTPAASDPAEIGWYLTSGADPLHGSAWLTASDLPVDARTFAATIAETSATVEVAPSRTKSGAPFELELTQDYRILFTGTGQQFAGLDLISPAGHLVPGDSAVPFSFFLMNTPQQITMGQLGDPLFVDGTVPLDIGWDPTANFSELQAQVGVDGNPIPESIALFNPFEHRFGKQSGSRAIGTGKT